MIIDVNDNRDSLTDSLTCSPSQGHEMILSIRHINAFKNKIYTTCTIRYKKLI